MVMGVVGQSLGRPGGNQTGASLKKMSAKTGGTRKTTTDRGAFLSGGITGTRNSHLYWGGECTENSGAGEK